MLVVTATPSYMVEGSTDDTNPADGPPTSYGPANQAAGNCADGGSTANSSGLTETHLTADVVAQTNAGSRGTAKASAKAQAISTLTISYSWFDDLLAHFGIHRKLKLAVVIKMTANLNDGPAAASFAVFIAGGPPGAPTPSWNGSYSFARDPANAGQYIATRQDGNTVTEPNPGAASDYVDKALRLPAGAYRLTFEANTNASADGTVSLTNDCELFLTPSW